VYNLTSREKKGTVVKKSKSEKMDEGVRNGRGKNKKMRFYQGSAKSIMVMLLTGVNISWIHQGFPNFLKCFEIYNILYH
jgi:hypothetical protein